MNPVNRLRMGLLAVLLGVGPALGQPAEPAAPAEGSVGAEAADPFALESTSPAATGWVIDQADLLYDHQEAELNRRLADHEAATTNQIVLETVSSLGGVPLEDFSLAEATRLAIGQSDKDNGILFLVAVEDRAARIEVGYGLEATLPDALAGRILREEVVPRFRDGDYPAGLAAGVDAILGALDGSYRGSFLDRVPVVGSGVERARGLLDSLPDQSPHDQVFLGVFLFLFGPIVSLLVFAWLPWKKTAAGLGLGLFAAVATAIVSRYPWMLGALGILAAIAAFVALQHLLHRLFPTRFRKPGSGGGSGVGGSSRSWSSGSSSSSSSSSSFSGGGGSFGGGGASARW